MQPEYNLVDVVCGVVHEVSCQTDRGRTHRANLERHPRPVAECNVKADVLRPIRRDILVCRNKDSQSHVYPLVSLVHGRQFDLL